jgi:8-oxo-dGTP diphosphatase
VEKSVVDRFGNRVRVRACGICLREAQILLVNHKGLYSGDFWAPPGGGVKFGESVNSALVREFKEECQADITVGEFLFSCEFIKEPLHAIELYFDIRLLGLPRLGRDPELGDRQIISNLKFFDEQELSSLPTESLHGIFKSTRNPTEIKGLKGFVSFT